MAGSDCNPGQLLRVLGELDMNGRDIIVRHLKTTDGRDIKAARASCRTLRQLVDGSLQELHVKVEREDMELYSAARPFPLTRWPRCSAVTIKLIVKQHLADDPSLAGDLLSLPFAGLSPEARQRIEKLRVDLTRMHNVWQHVSLPGASLAALLRGLPALRSVTLTDGLPVEPYRQQLMYDALASLPYLEELELPVCRALDGLGALAGSERLRKLTVDYGVGSELDAPMVEGMQSLAKLEQLTVVIDSAPSDIIVVLLRGLPSSLRQLELRECQSLRHHGTIPGSTLHFEGSRLVAMDVNTCWLSSFVCFVTEVLQPSGVLGQRLRHVWLDDVFVADEPEEQLLELAVDAVRTVLQQRCDKLEVGDVTVCTDASAQQVLRAMDLLGAAPRQLYLSSDGMVYAFSVQLQPQPPEQDPQPPHPPSLLALTVQSLVGRAPAELGQVPAEAAETAAAHPDGSSMQQFEPLLLLLHGPALAALASTSKILKGWMEELEERTEAAKPRGDDGGGGTGGRRPEQAGRRPLEAYAALPGALAVLVQCSSAAAAEAVAGAARAAAADAQGAAGGGGADLQLRVLRVAKTPVTWPEGANRVFQHAVEKAAQELYRNGGGSRRQRLQWLLEGWEEVRGVELEDLYDYESHSLNS